MASTLHLMPTKGMTLPFISYGGSSMLALALGMGMVLALTRRRFGGGDMSAQQLDRARRRRHRRPHVPGRGAGARAAGARLRGRAGHRPARPGLRRHAARRRRCTASAPAGSAPASSARRRRSPRWRSARRGAAPAAPAARPPAVVGFGGYPSVPTMLAAARLGLPTVIHEQNARARPRQPPAGAARRAHRHLLRRRRRACAPPTAPASSMTGNPVRPGDRGDARLALSAARRRRRRSSSWSSAAARARASSARSCRAALGAARRRRCAARSRRQQARPEDLERGARRSIATAGIAAEIATFFDDVPERLAGAQLVICRAGASTVAELARGRPAGDPGALSPRRRRPPDAPMPRAFAAAGARLGDAASGVHARRAGRRGSTRCWRDAATLARRPPPPPRAWPAATPRAARRSRRPARRRATATAAMRGRARHEGAAARHRHHPFRRHRRHRHERHRRDPAQSRLSRCRAATSPTAPTCGACARSASASRSATAPRISATRRSSSSPRRSSPTIPKSSAARARLLPVVRRAEMLGELMRLKWSIAVAGTHGKTTTTSMVGALLETAGLDPTVINGGIINAYGTNARLGAGDWMVVEADESDGTFVKLPATIAVVTNIDPEHLDFYGDFEALQRGFETFVANIPFYGFAVLCIDHPVVQGMIPRLSERRIVTYGFARRPTSAPSTSSWAATARASTSSSPTRQSGTSRTIDRSVPADVRRSTTCRTRWPRSPSPTRWASTTTSMRAALAGFKGVQAPLHQDRRVERRHGDRRLRPSPGRDRGGAERRARRRRRAASSPSCSRTATRALANLFERVLHLLQRRRHGAGRRRLCRRRGADRGHRPRRAGRRACARTATATCWRSTRPRHSAATDRRAGAARRHRRLPRRRLDHQLGATPARPSSTRAATRRKRRGIGGMMTARNATASASTACRRCAAG